MFLLAKYGTQTAFRFPVIKRGVVDLAVSADWTPATGDTKVTKDGGNVANTTNNPSAVGGTGSALWTLTLTATELQAAEVVVQIIDSATKAIEDQVLTIYTYGNASAKIPADLSDLVRLGLTALPNAAAGAAGGLPTLALAYPTGTVQSDAGNSASQFKSDRSEAADDYWNEAFVQITSGALAGQVRRISGYVGATKIVSVSPGFSGTPANGVTFTILNR